MFGLSKLLLSANVMTNSQQRVRCYSAPTEYFHEHLISRGELINQPASNSDEDYELMGNVDKLNHRRHSVDERVVRLMIAGAEFTNSNARSLPRRLSRLPRSRDRPADANRCDYFTSTDRQLPCTYVDRLLSPTELLNVESYRDRSSQRDATCLDDIMQQGCDEGTVMSDSTLSSPRHTIDSIHRQLIAAAACSPTDTDTCYDVMQCHGGDIGHVADLFMSTVSSDDTLSEHSLYDYKQNDSDDSDDDDDDDVVGDDTSCDWLTLDTDSNGSDEVNVTRSSDLQMSTVTQTKSVASQTSLELFALGSTPACTRDISTQTELDCLPTRVQYHQPTSAVTHLWQQRRVQHSTNSSSSCNEGHNNEENMSHDLIQAALPNSPSLWTRHTQPVDMSECVSEHERTLDNSAARDSVSSASLADQNNDGNDITLTLDNQQRKITVCDVAELHSAISDYDRLRVDTKVRDTLADGHVTKYDDNGWYDSVTLAADSSTVLATRKACRPTWHIDFERNTRIWKLLVS